MLPWHIVKLGFHCIYKHDSTQLYLLYFVHDFIDINAVIVSFLLVITIPALQNLKKLGSIFIIYSWNTLSTSILAELGLTYMYM